MRRSIRGLAVWSALTLVSALPASAQVKSSGPLAAADSDVAVLRQKQLLFPVAGLAPEHLEDSFRQKREGSRTHNAIDILVPRGTPVVSADSGRVLKLIRTRAGGLMVYAAAADEKYIFMYAHLDGYHAGLVEGMALARGDTIGYVGTTGNAPADTPHLHFAILQSRNISRWSRGKPINPYDVFVP